MVATTAFGRTEGLANLSADRRTVRVVNTLLHFAYKFIHLIHARKIAQFFDLRTREMGLRTREMGFHLRRWPRCLL